MKKRLIFISALVVMLIISPFLLKTKAYTKEFITLDNDYYIFYFQMGINRSYNLLSYENNAQEQFVVSINNNHCTIYLDNYNDSRTQTFTMSQENYFCISLDVPNNIILFRYFEYNYNTLQWDTGFSYWQDFIDIRGERNTSTLTLENLTCLTTYVVSNNDISTVSYFNNYIDGVNTTAIDTYGGDKYTNGYTTGYYQGRNAGYSQGYQEGYIAGQEGQTAFSKVWNFLSGIFGTMGSIFAIQLFPGVPIGIFLLVPLFFSVVGFILWIWRKGS